MTKYYIGFAASQTLATETHLLLDMRSKADIRSQLVQLEKVVDAFIPDVLDNLLLRCCVAIGIGPMASKIVNGGVDTINAACNLLISQLMKKRSDQEVVALVKFIDAIFIPAAISSNKVDSAGAEISAAKFAEMKHVIVEIQAGRASQVLPQLHVLMIEVADLIMEGFMKTPISLLELNFVVRKVCDGAMATCKGAAHMVVNRVFKHLNDQELLHMANYFNDLMITSEPK